MKKFTKVLSLGALATLLLGGVATLSSCGEKPVNPTSETSQPSSESSSQPTTVVDTESAEDLARLIILDGIHGKTVSTNFTLPQVVGKNNTKITWVSDDTNFLTFEVDANGETVTAKITRPAADSGRHDQDRRREAVLDEDHHDGRHRVRAEQAHAAQELHQDGRHGLLR